VAAAFVNGDRGGQGDGEGGDAFKEGLNKEGSSDHAACLA
jgi:hypothetical protein